jgi:Secretion system C-terminal sorting domain
MQKRAAFSGCLFALIISPECVGVQNVNMSNGFTLTPNPNGGTFTIKGTLKNQGDQASIRATDMLGKTVYTNQLDVRRGAVDEFITLPDQLADGMYMVSITSGDEHAVFHVTVNK